MIVPSWVQKVLTSYDSKTEAHSELDVAAALSSERAKHGDLSEQDWMPCIAEHSVFYFGEAANPVEQSNLVTNQQVSGPAN